MRARACVGFTLAASRRWPKYPPGLPCCFAIPSAAANLLLNLLKRRGRRVSPPRNDACSEKRRTAH